MSYGFYSGEESAMEKTVIRNAYVASQDPLIGNQADLDILIEGYDHLNLPMDVWVTGVLDFLEGKAW